MLYRPLWGWASLFCSPDNRWLTRIPMLSAMPEKTFFVGPKDQSFALYLIMLGVIWQGEHSHGQNLKRKQCKSRFAIKRVAAKKN
uniref:Uncharacterized protein n=1 Tax=Rhizophora mucronata TaxID=61149 RepID=A0A2P2QBC8_RHIMU